MAGTTDFALDPEIKRELVWAGPVARPSAVLLERAGPLVRSRDGRGWIELGRSLPTYLSMLGEFADPGAAPELVAVRSILRGWRFYDALRTDDDAPARRRQVGTRTPVLAGDGADLAATLLTIRAMGDGDALAAAVDDAFPGARISVSRDGGWFEVGLEQDGVLRRMGAAELSDGTLRYLLLVAALLSPRPPGLLVLNEPETSLHRDLLPALGPPDREGRATQSGRRGHPLGTAAVRVGSADGRRRDRGAPGEARRRVARSGPERADLSASGSGAAA